MEYSELVFRSKMLEKMRYEENRDRLIAASYTAWQMRRAQGDKTEWGKYIKALGLSEETRLEKSDIDKAKETAAAIHRDLVARRKVR